MLQRGDQLVGGLYKSKVEQNKCLQGFLLEFQRIQDLSWVQSNYQSKISLIINLDPSRKWFYGPYESDYLDRRATGGLFVFKNVPTHNITKFTSTITGVICP